MRKFNKSLAVMSLLSPFSAFALGIGEIKLHSALNENLRADIPLINTKGESLSDIQVSMASPAAFAQAGLDRQFLLSNLRFRPIKKPDGSIVVKVTSTATIREPFLNFLVEVNWPKGKLLREFTLLLDPPVTFKRKTEIVTSQPTINAEPRLRPADVPPTPKIPEPQIAVVSAPVRQTRQHAPRSLEFGDQYGPVVVNDTLWKVVKSVRTDDQVTDEQLMIAIFEKNPRAFYKNNINALKAGQVLNIPEVGVISRRSHAQAMADYKRQNDVWYGRISDEPPARSSVKSESQLAESNSQLKLMVPSDAKDSDNEQLGSGPAGESTEKSKADVAIEMATTVSQENEDLRVRLAELETQLKAVQRLVSLKDEQLAALQANQANANLADESSNESLLEDEQPAQSNKSELLSKADPQPIVAPSNDEAKAASGKVQPKIPEVKKPKAMTPPPPSETEEGFLSEFISEPYYVAAAGAGMVLLGLMALVIFRRNRALAGDDAESILTVDRRKQSNEESTETVTAETIDPTNDSVESAESSFLSEFTPSDFDALDTEHDEVDPISEADVYLAYGRYQQAEDLIRQAIADNPERDECKLKLLEIHYARENKEAFESYAMELSKDKQSDIEFWEKVTEMGREICPHSALFSGLNSAVEETSNIVGLANNTADKLTDESDGLAGLDVAERGVDSESRDGLGSPYDYSTSSVSDDFDEPSFNSDEGSEQNSSVDFEVPDEVTDGIDEESIDALGEFGNISETDSSIESFEFESGLTSVDSVNQDAANELSEFDENANIDLNDTLISDFNIVESAMESGGIDEGLSGFTDIDEIENKLDLAKACVDMDDSASAKELLEEVLEQGNETQKSEARGLLEKLEIKG